MAKFGSYMCLFTVVFIMKIESKHLHLSYLFTFVNNQNDIKNVPGALWSFIVTTLIRMKRIQYNFSRCRPHRQPMSTEAILLANKETPPRKPTKLCHISGNYLNLLSTDNVLVLCQPSLTEPQGLSDTVIDIRSIRTALSYRDLLLALTPW